MVGWHALIRGKNFEVDILTGRSRIALNIFNHNQHDSPLEPSVCGLDLGDCPYVPFEIIPGRIERWDGELRGGDANSGPDADFDQETRTPTS